MSNAGGTPAVNGDDDDGEVPSWVTVSHGLGALVDSILTSPSPKKKSTSWVSFLICLYTICEMIIHTGMGSTAVKGRVAVKKAESGSAEFRCVCYVNGTMNRSDNTQLKGGSF